MTPTDVSEQRKPIMVRALLTESEWTGLRKLALDRNTSAAELIGTVLREFLCRETGLDVYR